MINAINSRTCAICDRSIVTVLVAWHNLTQQLYSFSICDSVK